MARIDENCHSSPCALNNAFSRFILVSRCTVVNKCHILKVDDVFAIFHVQGYKTFATEPVMNKGNIFQS